jgi:spermidine/putrescine transport system substrate-binding protein
MKRFLIFLLAAALLLSAASCGKRKPVLYVFNWSDYIDPELVDEFEEKYGCEVKESYYDSNENMLTKIESSRQSYDIAVPSGDHVNILARKGHLEKLDLGKLTYYANLDTLLLAKARSFDANNEYGVPYFWGLTGLMYNKQYVPEDVIKPESWAVLGDKFFSGKQKVTMLEDAREVVGAALVYKGYNLNDTSPEALQAATEVLAGWDRNVTQYDSESYKNEVADGTTWLAQAYNGDALQQMAQNEDIGFFLPMEGSSLWMDCMVILKSSQNKDLAYKFIDFLLDAENAKRNAEYTQYPTPNQAAYSMLDKEATSNRLIYPDQEYLGKCSMIEFIGDRVKDIDAIFEKIRMN